MQQALKDYNKLQMHVPRTDGPLHNIAPLTLSSVASAHSTSSNQTTGLHMKKYMHADGKQD